MHQTQIVKWNIKSRQNKCSTSSARFIRSYTFVQKCIDSTLNIIQDDVRLYGRTNVDYRYKCKMLEAKNQLSEKRIALIEYKSTFCF